MKTMAFTGQKCSGNGREAKQYPKWVKQLCFISVALGFVLSPTAVQPFAPTQGGGFQTRSSNGRNRNPQDYLSTTVERKVIGAAATLNAPLSNRDHDAKKMSDFERRMRGLVQRRKSGDTGAKRKGRQQTTNIKPPNVQVVNSLSEYKTVVADEKDRIVVVRFHASWCRACKAVAPAFYRQAKKYPHVSFVEVPVTEETAEIHQGLDVPSVPFCHIYHPYGGLVEELRMSRKYFPFVERALKNYVDESCDLPDGDISDPYGRETAE